MRRILANIAFVLAAVALFAYSFRRGAEFGWVEAVGFVTGLWCVWLTIVENVWNFPIGIANCVFLGALFLEQRLFADAGLQLMFIALGLQGWYLWLYGGAKARRRLAAQELEVNPPLRYPRPEEGEPSTVLHVTRADLRDLGQSVALIAIALPLFTWRLTLIKDAAPFWDALITVLSIVAQVLLNRKRLENWWVWLVVDLVSVWLYFDKHVRLTGLLYAVYCIMAVMGYVQWRKVLGRSADAPSAGGVRTPGPQEG